MVQNISTSKDLRVGGNALWGETRKSESNYCNNTHKKTEKLTTVHKYCFKQKLQVLKGSLI